MRARHRHFNPTAAGATAVFDSRYITGLNDNDSVATWTSRSGSNDISQATAGNRPVYRTNRINGSPAVIWDGGDNDQLNFSSALSYSNNSILCVYKNADATNGSVVWCRNNSADDYMYFATNSTLFDNTTSGQSTRTHNLGNVTLIASGVRTASTNMTVYVNGTAGNTDTTGIQSTWTTTGIGRYSQFSANYKFNTEGDLGVAVLANVAWTSSVRKRCEHAAAYSFKIACN